MKTMIAGAVLLSTSAMAHDTHFSTDSCDIDLNSGLSIQNDVISFSKKGDTLYQLINDQQLVINDKTIVLTTEQQAVVTQYSREIRGLVPEVKSIAIDAIELASEGVNLAFDELLGAGNKVGADLSQQLNTLKDDVESNFDVNRFAIDEHGSLDADFLGEDFEQKIENIVEETVQNSMGTLLIAVGQELLLAGGNMDAFEEKMEKFGEQVEYEMESRAEVIEQKAEGLCKSVESIDQLEEQLKRLVAEMPQLDVITVQSSDRKKA
ncbi:DUF2884 family protein [Thalassotalea sp. 1_MG-2023]|uniref:DUF2884 family protein n=1 Tax=Thalassotalea sp. 1_MG-2023 TaxID=3062680 RepID=UPI0026E16963|nr:DUF2884 family protein [Thalassotalea sp. 1_MG-2023]MDO6427835.1 DUF2884 family protein [Thalassotalea sp. 1_MG-2023]